MTRAPSFEATSAVRSADPLSTTRISSQHRKLSIARAMFRSSLDVMMVAEIFIATRSVREQQKNRLSAESATVDRAPVFLLSLGNDHRSEGDAAQTERVKRPTRASCRNRT